MIAHIQAPDVDALNEELVSKGISISLGPVDIYGQRQLYVYDPSGYNLVFVQLLDGAAT